MRLRKILIGLIVLIALITAAIAFAPWQGFVQQKLIAAIEKKGISPVTLTINSIGLHGLVLKEVTLGEPPLKLANLTVGYSPKALRNGEIKDVLLSGLNLNVTRTDTGWSVAGLDALLQQKPNDTTKKATIPVTADALAAIPFDSVGVTKSTVHVEASGWQADAPLELMLHTDNTATLTLESAGITATKGSDKLDTGKLQLALALDAAKQQWHGKWSIENIVFVSESAAVPKMNASGEVTLTADNVQVTGALNDTTKTYNSAFVVDYNLSKPDASLVTITHASFPWGGGKIATGNVKLPLSGKKSVTVNVEVQKIAIDTLLQALTSNKTTATGVVSGKLPIIIAADGTIGIGKGALMAEQPGVIALAPETIPGDNAQVTLVRDVLKNLHYTVLSLALETTPDNKLSALLAVEGNNPDVQNGRAIKLQVHLSGDVLNLITQNLKLMTDPKTFIEQENHDKN